MAHMDIDMPKSKSVRVCVGVCMHEGGYACVRIGRCFVCRSTCYIYIWQYKVCIRILDILPLLQMSLC